MWKDAQGLRRKFKTTPVAVINFLEGNTASPAKHAEQPSPDRHLSQTQIRRVAFVLEWRWVSSCAPLVDITIHYLRWYPTSGTC